MWLWTNEQIKASCCLVHILALFSTSNTTNNANNERWQCHKCSKRKANKQHTCLDLSLMLLETHFLCFIRFHTTIGCLVIRKVIWVMCMMKVLVNWFDVTSRSAMMKSKLTVCEWFECMMTDDDVGKVDKLKEKWIYRIDNCSIFAWFKTRMYY